MILAESIPFCHKTVLRWIVFKEKKKGTAAMFVSRFYFIFHPIDSQAKIELAKECPYRRLLF